MTYRLIKVMLNLEDLLFYTSVAQLIKYRCAKTDRIALCKTKVTQRNDVKMHVRAFLHRGLLVLQLFP